MGKWHPEIMAAGTRESCTFDTKSEATIWAARSFAELRLLGRGKGEPLPNRNNETIIKYLSSSQGKEDTAYVAMDMWTPCRDAALQVIATSQNRDR